MQAAVHSTSLTPVSCFSNNFFFFWLGEEETLLITIMSLICACTQAYSKMGPKDWVSVKLIEPFPFSDRTPFLAWPTTSRDVVNCLGQIRVSGGSRRRPLWGLFNLPGCLTDVSVSTGEPMEDGEQKLDEVYLTIPNSRIHFEPFWTEQGTLRSTILLLQSNFYTITEGMVLRPPFNITADLKLWGWVSYLQYTKVHFMNIEIYRGQGTESL